jgi:Bacterial PH domain
VAGRRNGGVRIRGSRAGVLAVLVLTLCTLPLATARAWLAVLLVIPLAALLQVLRTGVDVDPDGVTVRAAVGRRRVGWGEVTALRATPRGELRLVLAGGRELRLPVARARHLPLIAAGSGGRVPAPAAPAAPAGPADQ